MHVISHDELIDHRYVVDDINCSKIGKLVIICQVSQYRIQSYESIKQPFAIHQDWGAKRYDNLIFCSSFNGWFGILNKKSSAGHWQFYLFYNKCHPN